MDKKLFSRSTRGRELLRKCDKLSDQMELLEKGVKSHINKILLDILKARWKQCFDVYYKERAECYDAEFEEQF